mmetsp:Transcript_13121/g.22757  ORF Transcript_13121/g.22757 Transcript_13121/m.22757 type:complete len:135 (-) Transcript_13121:36-440(-)
MYFVARLPLGSQHQNLKCRSRQLQLPCESPSYQSTQDCLCCTISESTVAEAHKLKRTTFNCSESFTQVPGTFITEVVVSNKQLVESLVLLQKRRNCGAIGVCDLSTLQKEDTAVPKVMCADSKMRWYQIFTHWS